MAGDEEFMRLTHKYFSSEHFYRGCMDADHHTQHNTSLQYIIDCFLG
ncbi:hypothetical protein HYW75_02875 [Candidatus Pacearchaeota archaeon]|nr:hypothetical protein [Candidatus Pacearchaeota archaeon]